MAMVASGGGNQVGVSVVGPVSVWRGRVLVDSSDGPGPAAGVAGPVPCGGEEPSPSRYGAPIELLSAATRWVSR